MQGGGRRRGWSEHMQSGQLAAPMNRAERRQRIVALSVPAVHANGRPHAHSRSKGVGAGEHGSEGVAPKERFDGEDDDDDDDEEFAPPEEDVTERQLQWGGPAGADDASAQTADATMNEA